MAYRAHTVKTTVYPMRVLGSIARHPTVPACGRWLHAAGPWAGGDGCVEDRPLPHVLRLRQASTRHHPPQRATAATSKQTPTESAPRKQTSVLPPLAVVVQIDIRRGPSARSRKRSSSITCADCVDCHMTRAVHMVSVDMSGSAQGRWRRVRVPQPVKR